MDLLLFITAAAHIVYTPFTKVEESFNLQAIHDILYLRHNFTQYDHHEFPGVVPRTFLGPLFISILSSPFILLFETLHVNKYWALYIVRLVLSAVVATAWTKLKRAITKIFGSDVSLWFSLITLTQFHFIFYMSRPLPNIMALPLVLYALAYWLNDQIKPFIICSGIAILVFRSELIIFLGLLLLLSLLYKKVNIPRVLKIALPAGIVILASSLVVDSFFWQRLLWPEGEVLWYNTILNKSSDWGTSPFLWYFYSAMPRAMAASLVFVPIGFILERRLRPIVIAAIAFVAIYSILPHKELRFIIYVFPVLNLAAAAACHRLWSNSAKSLWHGLLSLCAGGHLLLNVFVTLFLLMVSGTNYPGGAALTQLHYLEMGSANVSVHISNLAAQSGVSRFLQINNDWRYCKREQMNYTKEEALEYTHLIVEAKNKINNELWSSLQEDFDTMEFVDCFNSIGIQYNSLMPIKIKTKPCLAILKRKSGKVKASLSSGEVKEIKKRKKKSLDEEVINEVFESEKLKRESSEKTKKKTKKSIEEPAEDFIKPKVANNENKHKKSLEQHELYEDNEEEETTKYRKQHKKSREVTEDEEDLLEKSKEKRKRNKSQEIAETKEDTLQTDDEEYVEKAKERRKKLLDNNNVIESKEDLDNTQEEEIIKPRSKSKKQRKLRMSSNEKDMPAGSGNLPGNSQELNEEEELTEEQTETSPPSSPEHKDPELSTLLGSAVSLEDDAIVSTVESYEDLPNSDEFTDSTPVHKEINFQELRNLALGQVNRKTKATKLKIRRLIEQHFRSKGKHIENDSIEKHEQKTDKSSSTRQSVKAIIKQERIKDMIEQISTMDLTKLCNLDKVSTKDCLKSVIDKIDEEDKPPHPHS